jgi:alpha-mannosidase
MSTVKLAEDCDGVVIRAYNIAGEPVEGAIRLNEARQQAYSIDLNEENPGPIAVRDGAVPLALKPNEITTLLFAS